MRGMWGVEDPLAFSGVEVRLHGFLIHLVQSIMIIQFVVRTHEISSTVRLGLFDVPSDRHESSKSVYKLEVSMLSISSMWIALVEKQVKRSAHRLLLACLLLVRRAVTSHGPKTSSPT